MKISARGQVDPFIVMDVLESARRLEEAGQRIIHMEVGQPGTPAPRPAREALARIMGQEGQALGYTVSLGLPELRRAIARLYQRWYGVDLDPARVVVTAGSSAGFLLAFTALFDAGDYVALGRPGYPSYRQILRALSLRPSEIETQAETRYQLTPQALLSVSEDIRGVIIASPGNPTGTMLGKSQMEALIGAAQSRGISVISDEIYHGLHYGSRAVSALEITQDSWVINSFSKYFSMTGWRVGWMVVPQEYVRTVERLMQNMFICAPHASQIVALHALECGPMLEQIKSDYAQNRRLLLDGLAHAGFSRLAPPDGAFYIYADISDITDDSYTFAQRLLNEAGVAATPGLDFDRERGSHTLRFSYARTPSEIAEGVTRISAFMKTYLR